MAKITRRLEKIKYDIDKQLSIALIIKLTNTCNLSCSYCGVSGLPVRKQGLKLEKLKIYKIKELYEKVFNSRSLCSVDFIWHGGEPLLFGMKSFTELLATQKEIRRDGLEIKNSIQTNAALITDEWAKFFKRNNIQIGVSIDGPESLNNTQRPAIIGNSYSKTINGIGILKKHKISFGALSVITKDTINLGAQSLFNFFIDNEIKTFDFLPQEPILDKNRKQITDYIYPTKDYVKFAGGLFDLWYNNDDPSIHIPIFEEIIRTLLGRGSKICQIGHEICANTTFTFYPDGALRPCDKFPRSYGNINRDSFVNIDDISTINDIFSSSSYKRLLKDQITSLKMCDGCRWRSYCKGACTFDRQLYMQNKSLKHHTDCSTYNIYNHIYDRIKEQIGLRDGS